MIYYHNPKILRQTKSGKTFVKYNYFESFGREKYYAYSWGCKEKRGKGFIWLNPGEDLDEGISRRNKQRSEF